MIWRGCGGMYTLSPDKGSLRLLLMSSSNSLCSHLPTDILTWEMMYVQVYLLLRLLQQKSLKQGKYHPQRRGETNYRPSPTIVYAAIKRNEDAPCWYRMISKMCYVKQSKCKTTKRGNRKREKGGHCTGLPFLIHIFTIWSYFGMII